MDFNQFKQLIWSFYAENKRDFLWRHESDPYKVVLSEAMLQQTQTIRVVEKYRAFIDRFPTITDLAAASFADVLSQWNGLGYNRRALFLHKLSHIVVKQYGGIVPCDQDILVSLPGIGKATAASICAFAYNKPTVFIETNIRTVFLHHFFPLQDGIDDKQLLPLIEKTVDFANPRDWYYALMDYGVYLKQSIPNPSRKSKHHTKQSKFHGSDRQIRGAVLRALLERKMLLFHELLEILKTTEANRIIKVVQTLAKDGLIIWNQECQTITLC
jgi:A/G-specific adenine glycosylase